MDNYTKEILTILKNAYEATVGVHPYQDESETRNYYLKDLNDNLYKPMDSLALSAYGKNEIASGKMNALRSSSALTYNLFWDSIAEINTSSDRTGKGCYGVEFEKQYLTLRPSASNIPAHLDALLYCKDTCEAVALEMKMTEWIFNKPGTLRKKYLDASNYLNGKAGELFVSLAKELILHNDYDDPDLIKDEYPCIMSRYDAFQMFKHTVACYNACLLEEQKKIEKLTLVNCAWTLSKPELLSEKHRARYLLEEECEKREFKEFARIMEPVKKLFSDIGVDFDISFFTLNEFLSLLNKDKNEISYLRRYTFDN